MFLEIAKAKKFLEGFTKKNCKKTNQKEFRVEKAIKRMWKWKKGKATIVLLTVGLVKKT